MSDLPRVWRDDIPINCGRTSLRDVCACPLPPSPPNLLHGHTRQQESRVEPGESVPSRLAGNPEETADVPVSAGQSNETGHRGPRVVQEGGQQAGRLTRGEKREEGCQCGMRGQIFDAGGKPNSCSFAVHTLCPPLQPLLARQSRKQQCAQPPE